MTLIPPNPYSQGLQTVRNILSFKALREFFRQIHFILLFEGNPAANPSIFLSDTKPPSRTFHAYYLPISAGNILQAEK